MNITQDDNPNQASPGGIVAVSTLRLTTSSSQAPTLWPMPSIPPAASVEVSRYLDEAVRISAMLTALLRTRGAAAKELKRVEADARGFTQQAQGLVTTGRGRRR
ncbi:MAG: hypothetical protein R3C45_09230 [Phycisphaerales bacterium]